MNKNMDTRFVDKLSIDTREQVVNLLNKRVVELIDLTLATKQAHWTVKGRGYIGVHEMLDEVTERLRESADLLAERTMIIGGYVNGTVGAVAENSGMEAYPVNINRVEDHIRALTKRFADVGGRIRESIDQAAEAGDEDTADIFTEVSRQIDKDAWFIGANLTEEDA